MHLTITGANGFVGTRLLHFCRRNDFEARTLRVRGLQPIVPEARSQSEVFVHLAGIAHSDHPSDEEVMAVNRDLSIVLASRARSAGYSQFVFLSSALVWGSHLQEVSLRTKEQPETIYGRAKLEAEDYLRKCEAPEFAVSIVRSPVMYGPNAKGNFVKLIRAVNRWPVCPLGVTENRRSITFVDNLSCFILFLAENRKSGTFCAVDPIPVSTMELLEAIAQRLPHHGIVVPMPLPLRRAIQIAAPATARRLLASFVVNDNSANEIGFTPPFSMDQGFDLMVNSYLSRMPGL